MGNKLRPHHARRTWHDAFSAERRSALRSHKSASGLRRLRRGRHRDRAIHFGARLRRDSHRGGGDCQPWERRGLFTVEQYLAVEAELLRQLGDGLIHATYCCPDLPGQHSTHRKPAPGMIVDATREHQIDVSRSFLIGDAEIDVECAHKAGVRAIRVRTGLQRDVTTSMADWWADDLPAAAEIILATKA